MKSLRLAPLVLFPLLLAGQQADLLNSLKFRLIGPFRGGRSIAVAGVVRAQGTYYFGAVGGGVLKTTDAGRPGSPISDNHFKTRSVGAIAVAAFRPQCRLRRNGRSLRARERDHGDGIYKCADAGTHLEERWPRRQTYHIGAVVAFIHAIPTSSTSRRSGTCGDRIPNPRRSTALSTAANLETGPDQNGPRHGGGGHRDGPQHPRIYAALWQIGRKPWRLDSGGPGSGLFKTTDGGDNWTEISHAQACPKTGGPHRRHHLTGEPRARVGVVEASTAASSARQRGRNWTRVNEQNVLETTSLVLTPTSSPTRKMRIHLRAQRGASIARSTVETP